MVDNSASHLATDFGNMTVEEPESPKSPQSVSKACSDPPPLARLDRKTPLAFNFAVMSKACKTLQSEFDDAEDSDDDTDEGFVDHYDDNGECDGFWFMGEFVPMITNRKIEEEALMALKCEWACEVVEAMC